MTAIIVISCILLLIVFLLFIPVGIKLLYDGDFKVRITYLFLHFTLLPQKEKKKNKKPKKKKQKEPQEEKKEPNILLQLVKEKGINGLISLLNELLHILRHTLSDITKHLIIKKLRLQVAVGADNAADAALEYGYVCAAVYPILSMFSSIVKKCEFEEVTIAPDFNRKETEILLQCTVRIKLFFLVKAGIARGIDLLKFFMKAKPSTQSTEVEALKGIKKEAQQNVQVK